MFYLQDSNYNVDELISHKWGSPQLIQKQRLYSVNDPLESNTYKGLFQ